MVSAEAMASAYAFQEGSISRTPQLTPLPHHRSGLIAPPPFKDPPQPILRVDRLAVSHEPPRRTSSPALPGAPESQSVNGSSAFSWSQTQTTRRTLTDEDGRFARIPTLSQAMRQNKFPSDIAPNKIQAWQQTAKPTRPISERIESFQSRLKSLLTHGPAETAKVGKLAKAVTKPYEETAGDPSSPSLPNGVDNAGFTESITDQPSIPTSSIPTIATSTPIAAQNSVTNAMERLSLTISGSETWSRGGGEIDSSMYADEQRTEAPQGTSVDYSGVTSRLQLRDACNKIFGRDQIVNYCSTNNYASFKEGRNIKQPLNVDKVPPKETIGVLNGADSKPFERNDLQNSPMRNSLRSLPPALPITASTIEHTYPQTTDSTTIPKCGSSNSNQTTSGDLASDQGKSSSESGRGTLTSGFVTPKGERVSLWDNHGYSGRMDKRTYSIADGECSESTALSLTPPLPPITPPTSVTPCESPMMAPKTKYKVSVSAPDLDMSLDASDEDYPRRPLGAMSKSTPRGSVQASHGHGKRAGSSAMLSDIGSQGGQRLWEGRVSHWPHVHRTNQFVREPVRDPMREPMRDPMRDHEHCETCPKGSSKKSRFPIAVHPPRYQDMEMKSMTSCVDTESMLDDEDEDDDDDDDLVSSIMTGDVTNSNKGSSEVHTIRKQLEGLEGMYSEILKLLGFRSPRERSCVSVSSDDHHKSTRHVHRTHGSASPMVRSRSSLHGSHAREGRRSHHHNEKRKATREPKSSSSVSKRLQRLESHVVTLARSVAHMSSEMRTQHLLFQELESIRRDVSWTQEQLRQINQHGKLPNAASGSAINAANRGRHNDPKEWEKFRGDLLELFNPSRVRKLTKFFGDEPPLLLQFLKKLGYEKYGPNFESEKIGITELPYLTEERLQKIGIPMGPRMRILQEAQQSFRQDQFKIYIV